MSHFKHQKNGLSILTLWLLEGVIVGFGAILPGISGGTLCVAFGMYLPIIETLSDIKNGIKKHGLMLSVFLIGVAVGFIGLSGLAAMLLEKNTVIVTCAFIGFIIGTMPELWNDAGKEGRSSKSYIAMVSAFVVMLVILSLLKTSVSLIIVSGIFGYILCGILWGLSFIVPGLSSSSLLLFFGLYQPMLRGIYTFNFAVLLPMAVGGILCVLLLSKAVGFAYKKFYSIISHGVLGIVAATAIMILPPYGGSLSSVAFNLTFTFCGAALSYLFTHVCNKLKEK